MAAVTRLTAEGEEVVFAINVLRSLRLAPTKLKLTRRRSFVSAQSRLQLEMQIARAVGIAENYLMMRAVRVRQPRLLFAVPAPTPLDNMTKQLRKAREKFAALKDFWKNELGIDLQSLGHWQRFQLIRHLRHVLVHRLGNWQPALDPKPPLRTRMLEVSRNPDLYRGPVPLNSSDFQEAADVTLGMMAELEMKLAEEEGPGSAVAKR